MDKEKLRKIGLSREAKLLLLIEDFENLGDFLQQLDDIQLKDLYRIFTQGLNLNIVPLREIILVNAVAIYMKELELNEFDLEESNSVADAFAQAVVTYFLFKNGYSFETNITNKYFEYLYHLVKYKRIAAIDGVTQPVPPKVYLAIPYSTMEESAFKQATEITAKLVAKGINVFSPITHSHLLHKEHNLKGDWSFWQKIDFQYIDWCDEVWVVTPIEGYNKVLNSVGVQAEIKYAQLIEKPVKEISLSNIK